MDTKAHARFRALANENGKFAIETLTVLPDDERTELDRMLLSGEVQLIDTCPLAIIPGRLFNIYRFASRH